MKTQPDLLVSDYLDEGIILLDSNAAILSWNKWLAAHSDTQETDVIGKKLIDLYPELEGKFPYQQILSSLETGRNLFLSPRLHKFLIPLKATQSQKKSGIDMMRQSIKGIVIRNQNQDNQLLLIVSDVTERFIVDAQVRTYIADIKEQHENLEKAKELIDAKSMATERMAQQKSEYFAKASHELRTPLNSIIVLAHLLEKNKQDHLDDREKKYANTIERAGKDLLSLINGLLDIEKASSGKTQLAMKPIEPNKFLGNFSDRFEAVASEKGINFFTDNKLGDKIFVSDLHRLNQVVLNFISNAMKFTKDGAITVTLDEVIKPDKGIHDIVIAVKDTGTGIAPENLSKVFEPFLQEDGAISKDYGGTGLGLAICKEVATVLDGSIKCESQQGTGSIFSIRLPYTSQVSSQEKPPSRNKASDGNTQSTPSKCTKILIIDDDENNRFSISASLEAENYDVIVAENGQMGIDILTENPDTSLVLMDVQMPVLDGLAATEKIRKMDAFKDLPIVIFTAQTIKHDRESCMAIGATDYIPKPVDIDELSSLLQGYIK